MSEEQRRVAAVVSAQEYASLAARYDTFFQQIPYRTYVEQGAVWPEQQISAVPQAYTSLGVASLRTPRPHPHMLIIAGHGQVIDMDRQGTTDAQPRLHQQPKERELS